VLNHKFNSLATVSAEGYMKNSLEEEEEEEAVVTHRQGEP
jgi:hypothetical protein